MFPSILFVDIDNSTLEKYVRAIKNGQFRDTDNFMHNKMEGNILSWNKTMSMVIQL
jgi:hypothetical protein